MSGFRKVGVVGLGTMGAGIAEVVARGGHDVVGVEVGQAALERGRAHLESSTGRAVRRGRLTEEQQAEILGRVELATGFSALSDCDLVIEAVPERLELKRSVFAELDRVCRADAVLATNTSSLSVTDIAVTTGRRAAIVGVHFFNPAPVMKLVEVIGTVLTDEGHVARVADFVRGLGKVPVTIGDRAGFIANRLLFGYLNQAAWMYDSGHASREDIDTAMKAGAGLPMGPLTLLDLIGLDTALEVLEAIHAESRDRRHAPAPLLRQLVTAGLLGRKTGRGFYTYDRPGSAVVTDGPAASAPAPVEPVEFEEAESGRVEPPLVGVMGSGDAALSVVEIACLAGHEVRFVPGDPGRPDPAGPLPARLEESLDRAVSAGDLDEDGKKNALRRVGVASGPRELADCDLVIEAGPEDLEVKRSLIAALDDVAKPGAVVATTSSTVPVIDIATAAARPDRVVGMRFAGPGGRVVEVVSTVLSDPGVVRRAIRLAETPAGHVVRCQDRAGFIVDALRWPYLNDAVRMLEAGYADADAIDAAMTLGCGYPAGPIADLDRLGLDRAVRGLEALYAESREPALAPVPMLKEYVRAGRTLR
ncbi:MAG TPA: 3-hydroxybutyryl-CoA dehydrogenase [Actinomadura sp.]|jgi:3-hydroxybutyryl-CoA dehydrogenase|nr:3-hydroxybutyryl-CoA dehydrogenase [Actinomadura sp.]